MGGYDETNYLPTVLSTVDGVHFSPVANLRCPGPLSGGRRRRGMVYAFGGQTAATVPRPQRTDDIQMIDPATHTVTVVGHLPQPLYGAAAFVIDGHVYVAGGQVPGGQTLTQIDAFVPATGKVLNAGLLPQAEAFGGYTTVGAGHGAVGYIVGGRSPPRPAPTRRASPRDAAAGDLPAAQPLRGAAGRPARRAVRGHPPDRRPGQQPAASPSTPAGNLSGSTRRPPCRRHPGGFYFPDDAFFIQGAPGSSPIRRTTTPSSRSATRPARSSGSTATRAARSAPGYLNQPDDAYLLKNGTITVADASNNRILFISPRGSHRPDRQRRRRARPPASIAYPNGDTPLPDGNVLVSEINGSWIDEYTPAGKLVWTVHMPTRQLPVGPPAARHRPLPDDRLRPARPRARILEFTRQAPIAWRYDAPAGDGCSRSRRWPSGCPTG